MNGVATFSIKHEKLTQNLTAMTSPTMLYENRNNKKKWFTTFHEATSTKAISPLDEMACHCSNRVAVSSCQSWNTAVAKNPSTSSATLSTTIPNCPATSPLALCRHWYTGNTAQKADLVSRTIINVYRRPIPGVQHFALIRFAIPNSFTNWASEQQSRERQRAKGFWSGKITWVEYLLDS